MGGSSVCGDGGAIGNQYTLDHPVDHHTRSHTILPTAPPAPQTLEPPITHQTRAHTTGTYAMAFPVIDEETGQLMEYRQLRKHLKYATTWTTSYSNEMGHLCHGIGKNTKSTGKRVEGTDNFFVIHYHPTHGTTSPTDAGTAHCLPHQGTHNRHQFHGLSSTR